MVFRDRLRIAVGSAVLSAAGLWVSDAALAQWQEPRQQPPAGNPPGFVWTQGVDDAPQAGGQFNIAGSGQVGGVFTALGMSQFGNALLALTGTQNLIYGIASYDATDPGAALLLLQTVSGGASSDRFRVDRDGAVRAAGTITASAVCLGETCRTAWPGNVVAGANIALAAEGDDVRIGVVKDPEITGSVRIRGDLSVGKCFGPVVQGRSGESFNGNVGGYIATNARCPAGQHVCTTSEVLNSINCRAFEDAGLRDGEDVWVSNFAPSLPTPTNDCFGWTSAAAGARGMKWRYDRTTGGGAYAQTCDAVLPFACCG